MGQRIGASSQVYLMIHAREREGETVLVYTRHLPPSSFLRQVLRSRLCTEQESALLFFHLCRVAAAFNRPRILIDSDESDTRERERERDSVLSRKYDSSGDRNARERQKGVIFRGSVVEG